LPEEVIRSDAPDALYLVVVRRHKYNPYRLVCNANQSTLTARTVKTFPLEFACDVDILRGDKFKNRS
jgi:hypothetical protein